MQGASTGIVYGGLKYQARCISDVKADARHTTFLAGTLSLREENEVHMIRLSSSGTELVCEGLFYHPNEIWDLKSCPFDIRIFSTVFTSAAVWQFPELYGQSNSPQLEQLFSLDDHSFKIKCILWWPLGRHDKLISIDEGNLFLWSIDAPNKTAQVISRESVGMLHNLSGGAWDPHDQNAVAAICDSSLQCWDLRAMKSSNSIEHAHIRDIGYNPKKQHIVNQIEIRVKFPQVLEAKQGFTATAEEESGIRLWDLRMPKIPLNELPGHSHWTWAVRHNPIYEDLILSAGTDSAVNLWLAPISDSDNLTTESLPTSPTKLKDPLINSYNDYEDSVYDLAWSSSDPTIFASLSYDGRVVVESIKPYTQRK